MFTTKARMDKKEVFNILDNVYTYDDAQELCTAFGAELATYDQIQDAHKDGAEWCNYGWSKGQNIYYPTQKSSWDKLQKYPENKDNCGVPGVNGGYIENPYLHFGVNCYGIKPNRPIDFEEDKIYADVPTSTSPQTSEDVDLERKAYMWQKIKENAKLNPYNNKKWSEW